jgi:hypothetical protein
MGWFRKRTDPISDRARELNAEIADLEAQIKRLDERSPQDQQQPRLRSTAMPHQATVISHSPPQPASPTPAPPSVGAHEPIFEEVHQDALKARTEAAGTPDYYNELGVRKYDLPALIRRIKVHFRGPSTTNPKLVSYLAAGGIQGLRPLRYEKRVARNRFIALALILFVILLGLIAALVRHR